MSASNCPETPRQKMIQMMYLVYTAMLALNVSAEVISGFKTVGQAMDQSNKNVTLKIADTFDNFKFADDNNHDKVGPNYEKALEIQKMSEELTYYLDTTLYRFLSNIQSGKEAKVHIPDADTNKKAQEVKIRIRDDNKQVLFDSIAKAIELGGFSWIDKLDDTHEATNFFLGHDPEGKEAKDSTNAGIMKKKFISYKKRIKELLGDDSTKVDLGLRVERNEKYINPDGKEMTWEMLNFRETVAGAALVTLVRMKAEVLNAEYEAVNRLYKQISANDYSFDKVAVITRPSSSYILKGGTYELTVNVGAYDSKARFRANIGGTTTQSNDSGAVIYKTVCNATGPKTLTGIVYVKKDDGETPYEFKQSYYVAEPMAVFDLAEMNVVYKGIENPVSISVPGTPAHDVIVQTDPNVAEIVHAKKIADGTDRNGETKYKYVPDKTGDDGIYIITPKVNKGFVKVNVFIKDGKGQRNMGTKTFRARQIPKPIILLGNKEPGLIPLGTVRSADGIAFKYSDDFPYHLKLPVASTQTVDIPRVPGVGDMPSKGNKFGPDVKDYIQKVRPGYKINISAKVKLADGREETVEGTFRVTK